MCITMKIQNNTKKDCPDCGSNDLQVLGFSFNPKEPVYACRVCSWSSWEEKQKKCHHLFICRRCGLSFDQRVKQLGDNKLEKIITEIRDSNLKGVKNDKRS